MNLGKLLGAGKSFFGGGRALKYRADKNGGLPKFNAGKNPFANKPMEPVAVPAPATKQVSAPSVAAPKPVRAANWAGKLNPFRASTPAPVLPVKAEQVEFSLDAVKVLHNDLSDADVEVVPVKSRTVTPVAAPTDMVGEPLLRAA